MSESQAEKAMAFAKMTEGLSGWCADHPLLGRLIMGETRTKWTATKIIDDKPNGWVTFPGYGDWRDNVPLPPVLYRKCAVVGVPFGNVDKAVLDRKQEDVWLAAAWKVGEHALMTKIDLDRSDIDFYRNPPDETLVSAAFRKGPGSLTATVGAGSEEGFRPFEGAVSLYGSDVAVSADYANKFFPKIPRV